MGEVGGNGSVRWKNQHLNGAGKAFKCKVGKAKPKHDDLVGLTDLVVYGRDEVKLADVGTTPAPDLVSGLSKFQTPGYFLVRLRFNGNDATAIQNWVAAAPASLPWNVRMVNENGSIVLAINVKAVERLDWPADNETFADMPWEIRYDW